MRILLFFIILFISILIGIALKIDPGYVLIAYHQWTVEMPLWFAIISFVFIFLLLHYGLNVFKIINQARKRLSSWRRIRAINRANNAIENGIFDLTRAHWKSAEKVLTKELNASPIPLVNYLGAAYAAHQQQKYEKRDAYLNQLRQRYHAEDGAIDLVQAEFYIDENQFKLSLDIIQQLYKSDSKNQQVLRLLSIIYQNINDWDNLIKIIPQIKKQRALSRSDIINLEVNVYKNILRKQDNTLKEIQKIWKLLPYELHHNNNLIYEYSLQLIKFKKDDEAAKLISGYVDRTWDEPLVKLYGKVKSSHLDKQLRIAEAWLKLYGNNAVLLYVAGQIATNFKHWGKAIEYLNISLRLQKTPEAYVLLGSLYEKTGDVTKALKSYQSSVSL